MDPLGGMPLLARRHAIGLKPGVDHRPIRPQLRRRAANRRALRRRHRRRQRLPDRPPMHPMTHRQPPDREPLTITVPSDLLELFHSGFHSSVPPLNARDERQASGHDRTPRWGQFKTSQWGQFRPSFSRELPSNEIALRGQAAVAAGRPRACPEFCFGGAGKRLHAHISSVRAARSDTQRARRRAAARAQLRAAGPLRRHDRYRRRALARPGLSA